MYQCPKCGSAVESTETTCPNCTKDVEPPNTTSIPPPYLQAPVYAQPTVSSNESGNATASMVLGIIGLVMWCLPLLGLPTTIIGLVLGIKTLNTQHRSTALAGVIMSGIGLLASIINAAIGAYLGATGHLFHH